MQTVAVDDAAIAAAQAVNGYLALPQSPHKDFNDIHRLEGLAKVNAIIQDRQPLQIKKKRPKIPKQTLI